MKTKFLLLLFCTALISISVSAQIDRVQIKPEKVDYKRNGAKVPDHKKTFGVRYPRISGARSVAITENIKNAIDYWKHSK